MGVQVEVATGKLEGIQHRDHQSFLGIPFAKPPVGELRFRPPEPALNWKGVRDASRFGPAAPQATHPIPGIAASGPRAEDCLYLNVYTPNADAGRRPVLFWIHGGGFTLGSGSEPLYDGSAIAIRGDVVVVTIHYRLGALGYLYLGGHGGETWGAAANLGQLDQIAALTWVRENIAAFGGDPSQVILFGESAGAFAIGTLLAMPAARGLFRRVILQSGSAHWVGSREMGSRVAGAFLKELGVDANEPGELQNVPVEAILKAQAASAGRLPGAMPELAFTPILDGDTLPDRPIDVLRRGGAAEIELVAGTNRDEVKLFTAMDRKRPPLEDEQLVSLVRAMIPRRAAGRAADLIQTYRKSRRGRLPVANTDILDAIVSDLRFRIPAVRLVEAQGRFQPNTFLYLFCWESQALRGALGSCHGLEIPFVFGTFNSATQFRLAGTGPAVEQLSHQMMDAWIAFVRTGDPSHSGIGSWTAYEIERRNTMIFDRRSELVSAPLDEERAAWDEIIR